ncbi:MAG: DNA polymerase, partial [bacterium]|nr:DNA polymerase [bacterium]
MQKSRLMILDANALLHRAWHALPPLTNPEGKIVNAIYGVLMVVLKLLDEKKPDAFVACWDTKAPTFRHEAYDAYKAGREKQGDELYEQIPPLQEALSLLGVESIFKDGFEADDLIATIALQNKKSWDVMIVTGDRDTLQLVQPGISVLAFKKGVTDTILYDDAEVERQYGLKPIQFVDYKALRGDPSDNIPGVRGIGEKGATELLKTYGTMEGILKAAHDLKSALSPSIRQKMLDGEPTLEAGLALVRLIADVPIAYKPKERGEQAIDREGFMKFLQQMGFKTLLARFSGQAVKKENKEIQKQPKKQETVSAIEVKDEKGFEKMMGALRDSKEIVIETARAAQDSLFAGAAFGLVLGTGEEIWHIQETQIKKGKKELQTLFNREMPFVAHDAKSQQYGLDQMGLCAPVWSFDTMLAAYLLAAGERNHDLPSVAARYAELTVSEDAPATDRVAAILRLVEPLRAALKEEKVISVLERFELPLIDVLYQMEREGILIDRPYLATLSKEMTKEKEKIEKKMFTLAKREFNPASPSQLAVVLFEDLKLPTKGIKKGKQGYSTAAPELEKLRASHPIINLVDEHRELSKLLSTYVDVLPTLADKSGRVHTTFNQAVTSTGRLSSSDPNQQNIPISTDLGRQIRRAFIADTGKV